jgi:hypothetical protein
VTQPHQAKLQYYFDELTKTKTSSGHVVFHGDLDLGDSDIKALPDLFTVTGDLNLHNSQLVYLPHELIVGGDLIVGNSKITQLAKYTSVGGDLNLTGTSHASYWFSQLHVGGDLTLQHANITTLPQGLTVEGNLDLKGSLLRSLAPNLTVGDYLSLRDTNIEVIGKNTTIGYLLDVSFSLVTELPSGLTAHQLNLQHTKIKTLPEDLVVGDWINIEGTSIDPAKLPVGVAAIQMPNAENPYKYDIIKNPRYIDPTHSTKTCKSGPARRSHTFR